MRSSGLVVVAILVAFFGAMSPACNCQPAAQHQLPGQGNPIGAPDAALSERTRGLLDPAVFVMQDSQRSRAEATEVGTGASGAPVIG